MSNTWVSYLIVWDNSGKLELIPDVNPISHDIGFKGGDSSEPTAKRGTRGPLASW